jgi:hypothetical protein
MSATRVHGIPFNTAKMMDEFWEKLTREDRATLHTVFLLVDKVSPRESPLLMLMCGRSGVRTISSVRGDFMYFIQGHVAVCDTAEKMLAAILDWGKLTKEEQDVAKFGPV